MIFNTIIIFTSSFVSILEQFAIKLQIYEHGTKLLGGCEEFAHSEVETKCNL